MFHVYFWDHIWFLTIVSIFYTRKLLTELHFFFGITTFAEFNCSECLKPAKLSWEKSRQWLSPVLWRLGLTLTTWVTWLHLQSASALYVWCKYNITITWSVFFTLLDMQERRVMNDIIKEERYGTEPVQAITKLHMVNHVLNMNTTNTTQLT